MFAPFGFMSTPLGAGPGPTPPPTASIVTDQLRLYVDANNTTSYPGSGSTWYDLSTLYTSSTAKDLTLDASPTFVTGTPNYFDFTDGTDAATYQVGGTLTPVTSQGDDYTVCMFFAYHNSSANYRTIMRVVNTGTGNAEDFFMVNTGTNNLGIYDGSFNSLGVNVTTNIPNYDTQFNYQVLTMEDGAAGNDSNFYLNDNVGAIGFVDVPLRFDGPAVFGNQETGGQPGAKIAAILVYDKILSQAEITQNMTALSGSMGL